MTRTKPPANQQNIKLTRTKHNGNGNSKPSRKGVGGRPRKFNEDQVEQILELMAEYIETTQIPIAAEFAYKNGIPKQTLYDYEEFSFLLKTMMSKKEAQLERMALSKQINVAMAIFSLKQMGWSDKTVTEWTGKDGGPIELERRYHVVQEIVGNPEIREQVIEEWRGRFAGPQKLIEAPG